jgi:hypothetical protein
MSLIVVDVESDNQSPANGSMVCFGAVLVHNTHKTFYGQTKPICGEWSPEALAISGFSRGQHQLDIPDHTDPPNPGLKIDVEVHLDTDFACHSGGC